MSKFFKNITLINAPKALLSVNEAFLLFFFFYFFLNLGVDFNLFSSFSQEKFR